MAAVVVVVFRPRSRCLWNLLLDVLIGMCLVTLLLTAYLNNVLVDRTLYISRVTRSEYGKPQKDLENIPMTSGKMLRGSSSLQNSVIYDRLRYNEFQEVHRSSRKKRVSVHSSPAVSIDSRYKIKVKALRQPVHKIIQDQAQRKKSNNNKEFPALNDGRDKRKILQDQEYMNKINNKKDIPDLKDRREFDASAHDTEAVRVRSLDNNSEDGVISSKNSNLFGQLGQSHRSRNFHNRPAAAVQGRKDNSPQVVGPLPDICNGSAPFLLIVVLTQASQR